MIFFVCLFSRLNYPPSAFLFNVSAIKSHRFQTEEKENRLLILASYSRRPVYKSDHHEYI